MDLRMQRSNDVETVECLRNLTGHGDPVYTVSFDNQGLLASGYGDRMIKQINTHRS